MKLFIPDASLIIDYILDPNSTGAVRLENLLLDSKAGKAKLLAPYLLPIEVANVLRYSRGTDGELEKWLDAFLGLPIEYAETTVFAYRLAVSWARELGSTVYDATYHVAAWQYGATFVTCDRKYFLKAQTKGCIEYA